MLAYEVFLNGKPLCVAGVGNDGYISASVTYRSMEDDTWIDVIGLVKRKRVYVRWKRKDLRAGDEVLLKIVHRKSVDKYRTIRRLEDPKRVEESTKRYVRGMARRFGWKIQEGKAG
jgi:hypothetical protein